MKLGNTVRWKKTTFHKETWSTRYLEGKIADIGGPNVLIKADDGSYLVKNKLEVTVVE
jgi:hypothetical protein